MSVRRVAGAGCAVALLACAMASGASAAAVADAAGPGKIVFTSNQDGDFEIFVMNADGTGRSRLTANTSIPRTPRTAPGSPSAAIGSVPAPWTCS